MLRVEFRRGVCVGGEEIVRSVDLHAVPGEEGEADVIGREQVFELAELAVHVDARRVGTRKHVESVGPELRRHVDGVVHRVLQHAAITVSAVSDHARPHFPFYTHSNPRLKSRAVAAPWLQFDNRL